MSTPGLGARTLHGIPDDDTPPPAVPATITRPSGYAAIAAEVLAEIGRATAKFPPFHSPHEGYAILKEETDEVWDAVRADDIPHAITEAVQVAAMAIRFIHDLRHQGRGNCRHDKRGGDNTGTWTCTHCGDQVAADDHATLLAALDQACALLAGAIPAGFILHEPYNAYADHVLAAHEATAAASAIVFAAALPNREGQPR